MKVFEKAFCSMACLSILAFAASAACAAGLELGSPFSDNMVLQRGRPVPVWGWTAPKAEVVVRFAGQEARGKADGTGAWRVELKPMAASKTSQKLEVESGGRRRVVSNVLVGEVWLASGQSNMALPVWGDCPRFRDRQGGMLLRYLRRPYVRLADVSTQTYSEKPKSRVACRWHPVAPGMPEGFSAVAFYYALELYGQLDVPIGVIGAYRSGTNIDAWTPRDGILSWQPQLSMERDWKFVGNPENLPDAEWACLYGRHPVNAPHQQPSVLWNEMVAPIAPFAVRGLVWYQGCHNHAPGESERYCDKMHALYNGWASAFENPDFRLYFAQLAPWGGQSAKGGAGWSVIAENQARFAREQPKSGMAVLCDLGNLDDIHPNDKEPVARRLALHALKDLYGETGIVADSPVLRSYEVRNGRFYLTFDNVESWYVYAMNRSRAPQFQVAGEDGRFEDARLLNPVSDVGVVSGTVLEVGSDKVPDPKRLRYLWKWPWTGILYSDAALPLGVFSIDARDLTSSACARFDGFGDFRVGKYARVDADKLGLTIDSSTVEGKLGWEHYAVMRDRSLKPNTRYEVSFRLTLERASGGMQFLAIVRDHRNRVEREDWLRQYLAPSEEPREYRFTFDTQDDPDHVFQFHGLDKLKARITDFRLEERPVNGAFVPAVREPGRALTPPSPLPSGAAEFSVDAPRGKGTTLRAADFGVNPENPDNAAALQKALEQAKREGASALVLGPGVYRMKSAGTVRLDGFTDFTLDGRGAKFVSSRSSGVFMSVRNCRRTALSNFSLDWDWSNAPLASIAKVVDVKPGSFDLAFVDYADFPAKDAKFAIATPWDPERRAPVVPDRGLRTFQYGANSSAKTPRSWIAPNVVRISEPPRDFKVGDLLRVQHYAYDLNGFNLFDNEHLTVENVHVLSTPGHGFLLGGGQHHTLFRNVRIAPPEGDGRRVITCTSDHFHVGNSRGFLKLEGCEFSLGADDILNLHDCSGFAVRVDDHTLRTVNARTFGSVSPGTPLRLRESDFAPVGFEAVVRAARKIDAAKGVYEFTFAETLPTPRRDGFVLFDGRYDTRNVIVRNCRFEATQAHGALVLARDVTIEDCLFRDTQFGAVRIQSGYTFSAWSEGYGATNVVIRRCRFENPNPCGGDANHLMPSVYIGAYLRSDPSSEPASPSILSDILIEDCSFSDSRGAAAYISSAQRVTFRRNRLLETRAFPRESRRRAQVYCTDAKDVSAVDNVWEISPFVVQPGVGWNAASCSGVNVGGNRLEGVGK